MKRLLDYVTNALWMLIGIGVVVLFCVAVRDCS